MQENEIITFLIGTGIIIFIWLNRIALRHIPTKNLFVSAFAAAWFSWIFTNLEVFFLSDLLNCLEHICCTVSSILLAVACWKTFCCKQGDI